MEYNQEEDNTDAEERTNDSAGLENNDKNKKLISAIAGILILGIIIVGILIFRHARKLNKPIQREGKPSSPGFNLR